MKTEKFNDFSAGWIPSDDRVNGRQNGLLAMNNLELDQNGALVLCGGTSKIGSAFSNALHTLSSQYIGGTKHRYQFDATGKIFRDGVQIATGGSTAIACVGTSFEYALLLSGALRKKDNGITVSNVYVAAPATYPTITPQAPDSIDLTKDLDDCVLLGGEGVIISASAGQINLDTDATTFRVAVENTVNYPVDANAFTHGTATDDDIFAFAFQCESPESLLGVRFEILLDSPASPGDPVANYFKFEWLNNSDKGQNPFNQHFNSWSILQCLRKDFERLGTDPTKTWAAVEGIRITITATAEISTAITDGKFSGGTQSVLLGNYEWAQVNVDAAGSFLNKSILGPSTGQLTVPKSYIQVTPITPGVGTPPVGATEVWIFRKIQGVWYRVKRLNTTTTFAAFVDTVPDVDAVKLNIVANEFMFSLDSAVTIDDILAVAGPINGRMIYLTFKSALITEINSPGTYDIRRIYQLSGDSAEKVLWAVKVTESTILIGTTKDNYVLTGTWADLPDGFIDVFLRPLGTSAPALTRDVVVNGSNVIYFSTQGWVQFSLNGQVELLTGLNVDRLYRRQDCYGYSAVNIQPFSSIRYNATIARNKLWCINPTVNGSRRLDVYDFTRKYWRPCFLAPTLIDLEDDGNLIAYFSDDGFLRNIDLQTSKLLDGTTGQQVSAMWTVRDGGNNLNRKDTYNLTFKINTGGATTAIYVYLNESTSQTLLGTFNTSVLTEYVFQIVVASAMNLTQSWQFQILCAAASEFVLTDFELTYDDRPLPTTRVHIPATNFGSYARKRIPTIPFMLETFGSNVNIIPKLDGNTQSTQVVSTTGRMSSKAYEFTSDVPAIDWEFDIVATSGTKFEFGGMQDPKIIQVLPGLTKFYRSPTTNFGKVSPKEISCWPLVLNCMGGSVTVNWYANNTGLLVHQEVLTGSERTTYHSFFVPSVRGVDWYFTLSSTTEFEFYPEESSLNLVDFSYVFPNPTRLVQIGPLDVFRYGKIKAFRIVLQPTGTTISWNIQADSASKFGSFTASTVSQLAYEIPVSKTLGGSIITCQFTATEEFYYMSVAVQHSVSGKDSDLKWSPWTPN